MLHEEFEAEGFRDADGREVGARTRVLLGMELARKRRFERLDHRLDLAVEVADDALDDIFRIIEIAVADFFHVEILHRAVGKIPFWRIILSADLAADAPVHIPAMFMAERENAAHGLGRHVALKNGRFVIHALHDAAITADERRIRAELPPEHRRACEHASRRNRDVDAFRHGRPERRHRARRDELFRVQQRAVEVKRNQADVFSISCHAARTSRWPRQSRVPHRCRRCNRRPPSLQAGHCPWRRCGRPLRASAGRCSSRRWP